MNRSNIINIGAWSLLCAIFVFYILTYAIAGVDNNDTGFILGLAYQIFKGEILYRDLIYVRPPISPILHSFVFYKPFVSAPILIDRIFFYFQILTYSSLPVITIRNWIKIPNSVAPLLVSIIFLFSAHSFPAMAWHTTDGIFFGSLSLYWAFKIKLKTTDIFLSIMTALLAAGSKQPFAIIIPLVLMIICINNHHQKNFIKGLLISVIGALVFFTILIIPFTDLTQVQQNLHSTNSLRELYLAGFYDYYLDIKNNSNYSWFLAVSSIGLLFLKNRIIKSVILISVISYPIYMLLLYYHSIDQWANPTAIYDAYFLFTGFICCCTLLWKRDKKWFYLVAIHLLAWSSSISWGYTTSILYFAPSVMTLWAIYQEFKPNSYLWINYFLICLTSISFLMFFKANQYYYSMESKIKRTELIEDSTAISSHFRFILMTPSQIIFYKNLLNISKQLQDNTHTVLPNVTFFHLLTQTINPIGIDWVMNGEVGSLYPSLLDKIQNILNYVILFNQAVPGINAGEKYGSEITRFIKEKWTVKLECDNFTVYQNPSFNKVKLLQCPKF